MQPVNPISIKSESSEKRFCIPKPLKPDWADKNIEAWFVPLIWRDELFLPEEVSLEAYLICREIDFDEVQNWNESPKEILKSERDDLKGLMFKTKFHYHQSSESWRVGCHPMFKATLRDRIIISKDEMGVSVWSLKAFQIHHGKLRL